MLSIATMAARRAIASRRFWLSSTALTSLLLPLWSVPASAQQSASPDLTLPEIVVSGPRPARRAPAPARAPQPRPPPPPRPPTTRAPAPAPVAAPASNAGLVVSPTAIVTPERNVASSVTVITAAEMERDQRRTVPDALSTVPGLNIVQTGGPGGLTSIFMRGTNANHTKVFIDGIDVSDPSNPARVFDFGQLLTAGIERIEVLRGPQSGLYGADALGGVISIITQKGKGPTRVVGTVEGGSFGNFNQTANLSGSNERINYAFTAAHFRTGSTPVTPLELLPPGRARINDIYENWTYSTKLGVRCDRPNSRSTGWDGIPTRSCCLPAKTSPFSRPCPRPSQSIQRVNQFFQRSEAVWSLFDGRFTNYFGINYTDHSNWNKAPDPAYSPASTGATARGTIGVASYSRFPGKF